MLVLTGCGSKTGDTVEQGKAALCLGLTLDYGRTLEVATSSSTKANEQRDAKALLKKLYNRDFASQAGSGLETQASTVVDEVTHLDDGSSTAESQAKAVEAFEQIKDEKEEDCS